MIPEQDNEKGNRHGQRPIRHVPPHAGGEQEGRDPEGGQTGPGEAGVDAEQSLMRAPADVETGLVFSCRRRHELIVCRNGRDGRAAESHICYSTNYIKT